MMIEIEDFGSAGSPHPSLEAIVNSIPESFFTLDRSWRITRANRTLASLIGLRPEDLVGRNAWEMFPGVVGGDFYKAANRALDEQIFAELEEFCPVRGRWFEYRIYPAPDGLIVFENDITWRKEEQIRQQFLIELAATLRTSRSPAEVLRVATQSLGQFLAVTRIFCCEYDEDGNWGHILHDWRDGLPALPKDWHAGIHGSTLADMIRRGKTVALADIEPDFGLAARAVLAVPMIGQGQSAAIAAVSHDGPRAWTAGEIRLMEQAAEMIWQSFLRARAEAALRDSEERYRRLLELSPDATFVIQDDRVVYANLALVRLLGADDLADILGKPVLNWVHPDDRPRIAERLDRLKETGEPNPPVEMSCLRFDGSCIEVEAMAAPVPWNGMNAIQVIVRDITDRKRTEAALRDNEWRWRYAAETAGLGEFEFRVKEQRMIRSPVIDQLLELDSGEDCDVGDILKRVHAEDCPAIDEHCAAVLARPQFWQADYRVLRADGATVWIASQGQSIAGPDGKVARVIGILRDITAQKRAEEELRRARDMAAAASAAKTQFLAAVSHDLRQPIQAITLYLSLLARRTLAPADRMLIGHMEQAASGLQGMLNGLLDLAQLDAGTVRPEIAAFPLDDLLQRLRAEYQAQAEAAGLSFMIVPTPVVVASDPILLEQILRNLISNAIKYTSSGRVTVACREIDGTVSIEVADTGCGIPPDHLGTIFEDFVQLNNPARDRSRGLGVGLGTVARAAKLLDHAVAVRSTVGQGSAFTVRVPVATKQEPRLPDKTSPQGSGMHALAGRRILVVEDDVLVLTALEMLLRDWNMEVLTAGSVAELADLLPRLDRSIDLLIVDYRLPEGLTAHDVVRLVHRNQKVPTVILTGDTSPDRLMEAQRIGCRLMNKPIDPDGLQRVLVEAL